MAISKKRILHFHTNGKMATFFVQPLIEFEKNEGYDSKIITSIHSMGALSGGVIPFDLNLKNLIGLPFAFIRLCLIIYQYRPDLIFSHNFKSSPLPLCAAWFMRVPLRIYFNHGVPFSGYKGMQQKFLRFIEIINFTFATEVVTVSPGMRALLTSLNLKKKISLIASGSACGIDLSLYDSNNQKDDHFWAQYDLGPQNFVAAFVGRPEVRKGFLVALNLWVKKFSGKLDYTLILCGASEKDVIAELGMVPRNVRCLGFVENIPEILANTNCLILPSYHEGLPYSVLEAMASRCIVVANNVVGIQDLIVNKVNGFLVDKNSLEQYFEIITFINNQSKINLKDVRDAGRKTAEIYARPSFLLAYKVFLSRIFIK